MTHPAECACGHIFEVPDSLVGGIANCPRCGQATQVQGLNDPFWHTLRFAAVAAWIGATFLAYNAGGITAAVVTGAIGALILLLIRWGM